MRNGAKVERRAIRLVFKDCMKATMLCKYNSSLQVSSEKVKVRGLAENKIKTGVKVPLSRSRADRVVLKYQAQDEKTVHCLLT